jgi:allantoicase
VSDFTELSDLLAGKLGGTAIAANDDFFAPKENLVKAGEAVFDEHAYTDRGKLMDGWETRRRRTPGFDWCILRLGVPGVIRGVVIDTAFFKGNFPESASVEACAAASGASAEELASPATAWVEILPRTKLEGHAKNGFRVESPWRFTHVRLNIFPDGGVARLRVHGEPIADWRVARAAEVVDLAAIGNGGMVIGTSDRFFGPPHSILMPGRGTHMGDGWETRRRRGPGHDWVVVRLGLAGEARRIEVDTAHFKGNFPESCSIDACDAEGTVGPEITNVSRPWMELLPRLKLQADHVHVFEGEVRSIPHATHVRLNIFPDGGVSRLRVFGTMSARGRQAAGLRWLNVLAPAEFESEIAECCGSPAWARSMSAARPFKDFAALCATADRAWSDLQAKDWLEAFARHPRIGESKPIDGVASSGHSPTSRPAPSDGARQWAEQEQAGARDASAETRAALARENREYEARFGHVFLVCATGKTADDMLELLRARSRNSQDRELRIAAEEQRKITRLRLEKLIGAE